MQVRSISSRLCAGLVLIASGFTLPLAGATGVPQSPRMNQGADAANAGATPFAQTHPVAPTTMRIDDLPSITANLTTASMLAALSVDDSSYSPIQQGVAGGTGQRDTSRDNEARGLQLPEPGAWSATLATAALVLFFFLRRMT